MKNAVVYARYSSEKQNEQSIEGQLRVCQEYADRNDIKIIKTYIDRAQSGTNDNRTNFQKMLYDSNRKAWDYVIVYKLDRFSRNKYETAIHRKTLRDNGIKLLSAMENIPDTPEGIILESLLEGMAEYYSAELSQKVKRGMNESRLKGHWAGGKMIFGYRVKNKKPVIHETEAALVKKIFLDYLSEKPIVDIMNELNEQGVLHHGKPFAKSTFYCILSNEKYVGIVRHEGQIFDNIYPPIISKEVFQAAQDKLEENKYGRQSPYDYLLRYKAQCGYCGQAVVSDASTSKTGSVHRYYKCSQRKYGSTCELKTIRKDVLEKMVVDATFQIFDESDSLPKLADKILAQHKLRVQDCTSLNLLLEQKEKIETAIDNLYKVFEEGVITQKTKERIENKQQELEILEGKIAIEKTKVSTEITKDDIIKFLRTTLKKDPQTVIKILINRVVIYNDKIEIIYNYVPREVRLENENEQKLQVYKRKVKTKIETCKFGKPEEIVTYDVKGFI